MSEMTNCFEELLNERISTVFSDEDESFENLCKELEENLEDEEYDEIVELCNKYITNNSMMFKAYKKRSEAYWKLDDIESSLVDSVYCMMILNQYYSISPIAKELLPEIHLHIGNCLKKLEKYKNAINMYLYGIDTINSQYEINIPHSVLLKMYWELGTTYEITKEYTSARKIILEAIKLDSANKDKYKELLQKIENDIKQEKELEQKVGERNKQSTDEQQNSSQRTENIKIDITTCTKKDILLLECFNDSLASYFIEERDNGRMWYNSEDFWSFFELDKGNNPVVPLAEIEEKIIFPAKPQPKIGRTVDL